MPKAKKTKSYIFYLKGLDTQKIDETYGLIHIPNISSEYTSPTGITKLAELNPERATPEIISFLDEAKKLHKCNVSIIDFNTNRDVSGETGYDCFWCRSPFNSKPLGCPVQYVPDESVKTYQSSINKETYTMKEGITNGKRKTLENSEHDNISVINSKRYYTDGVFCHVCCIKAFIKANRLDPLYKNSDQLLLKMYTDLTGNKLATIDAAPSWRTLKKYGGHMTIEEFRSKFTNTEYIDHGILKVKFDPVGRMYEECIKF